MKDLLELLVSIPGGSGFEGEVAREMFPQLGRIVHAHKVSISFSTEFSAASLTA